MCECNVRWISRLQPKSLELWQWYTESKFWLQTQLLHLSTKINSLDANAISMILYIICIYKNHNLLSLRKAIQGRNNTKEYVNLYIIFFLNCKSVRFSRMWMLYNRLLYIVWLHYYLYSKELFLPTIYYIEGITKNCLALNIYIYIYIYFFFFLRDFIFENKLNMKTSKLKQG